MTTSVAIHHRLRSLASEPAARLDELNDGAWSSTDNRTLELCRLRIAGMLGDTRGAAQRPHGIDAPDAAKVESLAEWWKSDVFTPAERARLAFTEQFVFSVSSLSDSDVDALLEHEDEAAVYQFVTAIYVMDMTTRVDLMTWAIFDDGDRTEGAGS